MIDEILMEYIYDDHANCDDSCGKKADYTDLKSQLLAEMLKVIDSQEVDVEATRERMEELGASENEILNMEIEADDTKATLDGVRTQFNELFNVEEK